MRKTALGANPLDDLVPAVLPAAADEEPSEPPPNQRVEAGPAKTGGRKPKALPEEPPKPPEKEKLHRAGVYLRPAHANWLEDVRTRAMVEKRGDIAVSEIVRIALEELERLPWDKLMARLGRDANG